VTCDAELPAVTATAVSSIRSHLGSLPVIMGSDKCCSFTASAGAAVLRSKSRKLIIVMITIDICVLSYQILYVMISVFKQCVKTAGKSVVKQMCNNNDIICQMIATFISKALNCASV
jgi:hypothetical protein